MPVLEPGPPVEEDLVKGSLSPSRAGDFLGCPLLYRFRAIDRLPEPLSPDAARGTLVHRVLELLFDEPAALRTPARALDLLGPAWQGLLTDEPLLAQLLPDDAAWAAWGQSCERALARYFALEDPRRIEPAERERYLEALLEPGLLLRGVVDRIDISPDGQVRVVDYKTGRAPSPGWEARAFFQLRFYALVLWRGHQVLPVMLQLIYLGSGEVLRYQPDLDDIRATERKVLAVWDAITLARETGDWQPRPGAACGWCAHRALCPAYGGTPPPVPQIET